MIDRRHIEKILRINGLPATAEDEEIRSVLISARWEESDIETALTVLRENLNTGAEHVDTLHNVFNSDTRLSPESIQSLLGIEVEMNSRQLASFKDSKQSVSFWQIFSIIIYATILAFSSILMVMYIQNFGFFHPYV